MDYVIIYILEFIIIVSLSLTLTRFNISFATRFHIGDEPGPRKIHKSFKPYLGGLAVYFAVTIGLAITYFLKSSLFNQTPPYYVHSVLACTFIMLIGLLDDLVNLSFSVKFVSQLVAGILIVYGGMVIDSLYIPGLGLIDLGVFSIPFTLLWIIFITNAINLLDGLDGLAAGVSAIILFFFFAISFISGKYFLATSSLGLSAAVIGFLRYNYHPAKIFMGDAGSLFLGFTISLFSLEIMYLPPEHSVHLLIPITIMAVPFVDTLVSFFRRAGHRMHPFKADKDHIHHRLMTIGFSHENAVKVIYGMSLIFGGMGFTFYFLRDVEVLTVFFISVLLVAIITRRLGYIEIEKNLLYVENNSNNNTHFPNGNNGNSNPKYLLFEPSRFFQTAVFIIVDGLMVILATLITYRVLIDLGIIESVQTRDLFVYLTWAAVVWILMIGLNDLYNISWDCSRIDELIKVSKIIVVGGFTVFILTSFIEPRLLLHLREYIGYLLLLALIVSSGRLIIITLGKRFDILDFKKKPTIIIGASDKGKMAALRILSMPDLKFDLIGFIDERANGKIGTKNVNLPVLGGFEDIPFIIKQRKVKEVIIALDTNDHDEIFSIIAVCNQFNTGIKLLPDFLSVLSGFRTSRIYGISLIKLFTSNMRTWEWILKRIIDIVVSVVILMAFLPFWIVIGILIKFDSPGPVFYKQERVGKNREVFNLIKFRSMIENAEEMTGPKWAEVDDPRITRVGRFLRNTRLDEVPQFINVLMGKMSIVGPRPERPYFVNNLEKSIRFYSRRLIVKPGITGWAQIKHKYDETIDDVREKLRFDLYYIENMSILLDIKIISQTLLVGLKRRYHLKPDEII